MKSANSPTYASFVAAQEIDSGRSSQTENRYGRVIHFEFISNTLFYKYKYIYI